MDFDTVLSIQLVISHGRRVNVLLFYFIEHFWETEQQQSQSNEANLDSNRTCFSFTMEMACVSRSSFLHYNSTQGIIGKVNYDNVSRYLLEDLLSSKLLTNTDDYYFGRKYLHFKHVIWSVKLEVRIITLVVQTDKFWPEAIHNSSKIHFTLPLNTDNLLHAHLKKVAWASN